MLKSHIIQHFLSIIISVLKKIKKKTKSLSHFIWLILLVIITVLVTYFYEKSRSNQYKNFKKTLENIYLQKTVAKITSELEGLSLIHI